MPEGPLANSSIAQQTGQDFRSKYFVAVVGLGKWESRMRFPSLAAAKRLFQSVLLGADNVGSVIMASGTEQRPSNPCHFIRERYHDDIPVSPGR